MSDDKLRKEMSELRSEFEALRRVVLAGRHVDMIDFGELRAFMYTDDLSYRQMADRWKGHRPGPNTRDLSKPHRLPEQRYNNEYEPFFSLLFSHFWLNDLDFSALDVGCQYGISAMAIAQVILSSGHDNRVIAFDPGLAGQLVNDNLVLNGMQRSVVYERLALSNSTHPTILFSELGHSENNRVVNRFMAQEGLSYVIQAMSLDDYLALRDVRGNLIMKIDTQGGEVEVFQGMQRALQERLVTCLSEFTPHAIASRADPAEWLQMIATDFHLFDLAELDIFLQPAHRVRAIAPGEIAAFTESVRVRPMAYSDVLLIPKRLPNVEALLERITL